ncbi:MAG: hypothetical protein LC781_00840 [Actinobacteria bacterium]|nr:hypothetical protein [Actinomycetota bacterium]
MAATPAPDLSRELRRAAGPPGVLDVLVLGLLGLVTVDVTHDVPHWETPSESAFHTEGDETVSLAAVSGAETLLPVPGQRSPNEVAARTAPG